MERANKRHSYPDSDMVDSGRDYGSIIWLASARKYKEMAGRLDIQMRLFLSVVTAACFVFGAFSGASIHSLKEARLQQEESHIVVAKLIQKSLRELSEIRI